MKGVEPGLGVVPRDIIGLVKHDQPLLLLGGEDVLVEPCGLCKTFKMSISVRSEFAE